ncbi:MAG: hypothetical protein GY774_35360 [Planctomycetes bacterium]|nr:hypothetical protein [Planctomycetota bacterium]
MNLRILIVVLCFLTILVGCKRTPTVIKSSDGPIVVPASCEVSIKYAGRDLGFKGFKMPIQIGSVRIPVELAEFWHREESLREATNIAVILDNRRVENCKTLQALGGVKIEDRARIINAMRSDTERVYHLALLTAMPCKECVLEWVKQYKPLGDALAKAPEGQKGKAPISESIDKEVPFELFLPM